MRMQNETETAAIERRREKGGEIFVRVEFELDAGVKASLSTFYNQH